jgi:transcriptional regulator with XRE-family HTH domain
VAKHIGADRERNARNLTEAVGAEITELRKKRGWTQLALAELLGYDVRYIGQIERGEKSITLRVLATIAAGFEMRAAQIIDAAETRIARRQDAKKSS